MTSLLMMIVVEAASQRNGGHIESDNEPGAGLERSRADKRGDGRV